MHRLEFWVLGKTKRRKPLILLGFQRFLSSDIFDYFAVISDISKSLENRLGASPQGFESLPLRHSKSLENTTFSRLFSKNRSIAAICQGVFCVFLNALYSFAVQALPLGASHYARMLRATAEQSALTRLQASLQTHFA